MRNTGTIQVAEVITEEEVEQVLELLGRMSMRLAAHEEAPPDEMCLPISISVLISRLQDMMRGLGHDITVVPQSDNSNDNSEESVH